MISIKELKYSRLKPEEKLFVDILPKIVEFKNDEYPDLIFYKYNYDIIFDFNNKTKELFVSCLSIFGMNEKNLDIDKYSLEYFNFKKLFEKSKIVEKYFKLSSNQIIYVEKIECEFEYNRRYKENKISKN